MKEIKRVLIMAGGTGGHVFPGLAVGNYLREKGIEVFWLGTSEGLEARLVPDADFSFHRIHIKGIRRKGLFSLLTAPFKIAQAVLEAKRIIDAIKPDVVIGMGGYVSGPGGLASWLTRRPLIIHEQNAKAGLTNKVLARLAKKVLTGFPNVFPSQDKVEVVGNPVRKAIENLTPPQARRLSGDEPLHLLVLGGSLGAQALNELVPQAIAKLSDRPKIIHQTGSKFCEMTKECYAAQGVEVTLSPFIEDMAAMYSWADVVLCRAGALTVAELCAAGLGAIFVPYPFAVDDHQTANANFMVAQEAALCIQQRELTADKLAELIATFSQTPNKRLRMAEAAYRLRKINVAERIYHICKEICH